MSGVLQGNASEKTKLDMLTVYKCFSRIKYNKDFSDFCLYTTLGKMHCALNITDLFSV